MDRESFGSKEAPGSFRGKILFHGNIGLYHQRKGEDREEIFP